MKLSGLAIARKTRHMTQGDMAAALGIALSTYNMYEKGGRKMPCHIALRAAEILNIEVDSVFSPATYILKKL